MKFFDWCYLCFFLTLFAWSAVTSAYIIGKETGSVKQQELISQLQRNQQIYTADYLTALTMISEEKGHD